MAHWMNKAQNGLKMKHPDLLNFRPGVTPNLPSTMSQFPRGQIQRAHQQQQQQQQQQRHHHHRAHPKNVEECQFPVPITGQRVRLLITLVAVVVVSLGVRTAAVDLVDIIQQQDQEQQAEIVIQHAIDVV